MLRKLLITTALGTLGIINATPAFVASQASAATPKCLNKANKYVACTDKLRAKTPRKKAWIDGFPRIEGIKGETEDKGARRGPRLRAR